MTKKVYTRDDLAIGVGKKLVECFNAYLVEGDDSGLDGWFQPDETMGFRIAEPNTIEEFDGYTMGCKSDLEGQSIYEALPQEKKDLIPDDEVETLFFVLGTLKSGEYVYTHWLIEGARFAQKASCDWWDACEGAVLEEWGVEYDDVLDA